jgi:hypothetical protein
MLRLSSELRLQTMPPERDRARQKLERENQMNLGTGIDPATVVVWSGFGLSLVFGAVASKTNFCTMGAISDVVNMGNWGRMRMWLLAIAVAILGATALQVLGIVDLSKSIYQRPNVRWL